MDRLIEVRETILRYMRDILKLWIKEFSLF
mgnify:FL=1